MDRLTAARNFEFRTIFKHDIKSLNIILKRLPKTNQTSKLHIRFGA